VLPQNVYRPIRRMLEADVAVQQGDGAREIIPERVIPDDELGEIMRSRNNAVLALRRNERELGQALARVERIAADLKRKNHLLEAARRHLADADRLASLGMMSAGIAHELNTPLTVVKGLAEKLETSSSRSLSAEESALLLRVVRRLEGLGESLLDFARVRPPRRDETGLSGVIEEAVTLVRIDRGAQRAAVVSQVERGVSVLGDGDRLVQVFVNLIRNGVDAVRSGPAAGTGRVVVSSEMLERDGAAWVAVRVADDGPGIEADRLERVFEPFVSTKLDSRGTGLGLAVAERIVREHGGVVVATNRPDRRGAVFEVLLPAAGGSSPELTGAADG
ncbi:MAG: ATP-binding protein, partial [Planctomycetota bacterium]